MWLEIKCDLSFQIEIATPFILMLRPRSGAQQWVASEEYKITPFVDVIEFTDGYGNLCQRLIAAPGKFSVKTRSSVRISDTIDTAPGAPFVEIQNLPDTVLSYLLPSRYCESDRFSEMASSITAAAQPGYNQVERITDWLRKNVSYVPGSSNIPMSAVDVNMRQSGVCRDLSHLGIALCRSISIPARIAVGYLQGLEPMDMHAWFEAFVGGRWYIFDATQKGPRGGYVTVGLGRDAADVALYNQFGPAVYPLKQVVSVAKIKRK